MIPRALTPELLQLLAEYPVVTLLGPRQAGKTTLARGVLEEFRYTNLEVPETRQFAAQDPKAFLGQFGDAKLVIDEIQRVPPAASPGSIEVWGPLHAWRTLGQLQAFPTGGHCSAYVIAQWLTGGNLSREWLFTS